jgi:hypothetical protein
MMASSSKRADFRGDITKDISRLTGPDVAPSSGNGPGTLSKRGNFRSAANFSRSRIPPETDAMTRRSSEAQNHG